MLVLSLLFRLENVVPNIKERVVRLFGTTIINSFIFITGHENKKYASHEANRCVLKQF